MARGSEGVRPDAVLSHYSAAALWRLVKWDGRPPDVTMTTRRSTRGSASIGRRSLERTIHRGIPVTTLAGRSTISPRCCRSTQLRRAVREAYNQRLVTTAELARAQSKALRRIAADLKPTRNVLEDAVLDLLRRAGFEEPLVNQPLGCYEPDFRWRHRNLIVEADGAETHDHDLARHDDAVRQKQLEGWGYRVVRVSWRQAVLRPARTVARLRAEELRSRAATQPEPEPAPASSLPKAA